MDTFLLVSTGVLMFILIACILSLIVLERLSIRNELVYTYRTHIADENLEDYFKLPSYSTMLYYFWIPLDDIKYWKTFKYPEVNNPISAIYHYITK